MRNQFEMPRGFARYAIGAILLNIALFIGAVVIVAYAVKWVIS